MSVNNVNNVMMPCCNVYQGALTDRPAHGGWALPIGQIYLGSQDIFGLTRYVWAHKICLGSKDIFERKREGIVLGSK